jgi:peptidoglycan-N-acetylglucosamine deacetylase
MPTPITFTLDLEDHRPRGAIGDPRYPAVTRHILDRLAARHVTATVFVVGELAEASPALIQEVASAGHEIALHGWRHVPLTELDPATFRADVRRGRALLEDLTAQRVVGFRAPTFSLTATTTWATEVLAEEGFTYSSSVLPSANPLHGFPGAPTQPFLWPSGLAELPVPVVGVGRLAVPYLGGTYLRVLPRLVAEVANSRSDHRVPWTYLHPYDTDRGEPFWMVPDAGWLSPLLWIGRTRVLNRIERLLDDPGPPLRDRLDEAVAGGTFQPLRTLDADPVSTTGAGAGEDGSDLTQQSMVHRLPSAPVVDRVRQLTAMARGRRVVHVGFVDHGYQRVQHGAGTWLHGHLAVVASDLVGVDVDEAGVAAAVAAGHRALVADCRDPGAVHALGLEPAELVIAGEVIEHLDDPGSFLDGLHGLVAPDGRLVITTPNAYGLLNVAASVARVEVNHPDHVVMFTWRTLTALAARHGWQVESTQVYVPAVKDGRGAIALAGRLATALEALVVRAGHRYGADGLIVTFRAAPDHMAPVAAH